MFRLSFLVAISCVAFLGTVVESFTTSPLATQRSSLVPFKKQQQQQEDSSAVCPRLDSTELNIYSTYGYGRDWDYDYGGGLSYGTQQYRQRYNDGYFGGVNQSYNGYSQQTNVARGRGRIGGDYWGGRYGYDYDPYYYGGGGGGGYYLMGGGGYGGYGRGYGGYGGYGRGYGRGYYDDDYYGGGYYRGGYGRGRYGGYDDDYDDYYGGYGGYGGGYGRYGRYGYGDYWDSPLTTYDSGVNLSRYGTSMQDNIMYSGRNGRGRLYNNGLGRGGYYPSSFNYGYGGRYGGYYDDYW